MKKIFLYLLVFGAILSFTSCKKCMIYYACCSVGHPYWKGEENVSCHGDRAESNRDGAEMGARKHDKDIHGGVETAKVCSVYEKP